MKLEPSPARFRRAGASCYGGPAPSAPVAQLDRVSVFETEGWRFEPVRARHSFQSFAVPAVDLSDNKLAFAAKLGATQTVNAGSADAVAEIRRISGNGVDVAFEMAGSVPALELAYAATARGGATVTAGLPHPDRRMSLSPLALVAEERTLKGSYVGSSAPQRDVPRMIGLFRAGRLPVDQLLTHRLKLEEINEGFDRLREGIGVRQVVLFE